MPIEDHFILSKDPLRLSGIHLLPIEGPFRPSKGSQTDRGPLKTNQGPLRPTDGPLRPTEGPLRLLGALCISGRQNPVRTTEGPLTPITAPQIR